MCRMALHGVMGLESKTMSTKPAPTTAPAAVVKKATKPRETVFSKDDLVNKLQAALESRLNLKVSKSKTWELYKLGFAVSYELAAEQPLSLSGIGRFSVLESQRSAKANKPAKRMRFRTSSRTTELLNGSKDFYADLAKEPAEAPAAAVAAPEASAPVAAPAADAPHAAPAHAAHAPKAAAPASADLI